MSMRTIWWRTERVLSEVAGRFGSRGGLRISGGCGASGNGRSGGCCADWRR